MADMNRSGTCADCGKEEIDPDYSAEVEEDDATVTQLCAKCGVKRVADMMGLPGSMLYGSMLALGAMVEEDGPKQAKMMAEASDALADEMARRGREAGERETLPEMTTVSETVQSRLNAALPDLDSAQQVMCDSCGAITGAATPSVMGGALCLDCGAVGTPISWWVPRNPEQRLVAHAHQRDGRERGLCHTPLSGWYERVFHANKATRCRKCVEALNSAKEKS